jgi:hypothetical protein
MIFVLWLLSLAWKESKELIPAAQNGFDGLIDYLEFWNIIDWVSIFSGLTVMAFWFLLAFVEIPAFNAQVELLPQAAAHDQFERDDTLAWLTNEEIRAGLPETYFDDLDLLNGQLTTLMSSLQFIKMLMCVFSFVMMFRFFKAFRANPRLAIAVDTLVRAAVDILHFFVVFLTIFLVFTLIAYIMFGSQVWEFSSVWVASLSTFRVLMGDFDVDSLYAVNAQVAALWFISFNVIVLLILLNMLLAIVMDTYSEVRGRATRASLRL